MLNLAFVLVLSSQPAPAEPPRTVPSIADLNSASARLSETDPEQAQAAELREALASVKTLSGLIPICSHCKKIRDDRQSWHQLERYIQDHSDAAFSHGICPECLDDWCRDDEPVLAR